MCDLSVREVQIKFAEQFEPYVINQMHIRNSISSINDRSFVTLKDVVEEHPLDLLLLVSYIYVADG